MFEDYFNNFFSNEFFNYNFKRIKINEQIPEDEVPSGDVKITTGQNENGSWEKREWTSYDGFTKMTSYKYSSKSLKGDVDKKLLKRRIKDAVKIEDYETAAKLKKELEELDCK